MKTRKSLLSFSLFFFLLLYVCVEIIERYGWFAVFLLSAWPNAAFDMCGICCGAFQMPFWSFFLGVWTGKACVKVMLQGKKKELHIEENFF